MRVTFYTNPMSRGQIARWALHEVGAPYEEVLLEYGESMKAPEFLAVNSMGKVPAIVHEGKVITEAAAICLYLAKAYPLSGMAGQSLAENAEILRWMFFAAGPLEQAITNRSMGWDVGEDVQKQTRAGYGNYDHAVAALNGHFEDRAFVCGDRFTIADVYVGSQVDWGLAFKTLPETPAFMAYAERLRARSAYQESKAIDNAHIQRMQNTQNS